VRNANIEQRNVKYNLVYNSCEHATTVTLSHVLLYRNISQQ